MMVNSEYDPIKGNEKGKMDFVSSQLSKLLVCEITQYLFIIIEVIMMWKQGFKKYFINLSNIFDYA